MSNYCVGIIKAETASEEDEVILIKDTKIYATSEPPDKTINIYKRDVLWLFQQNLTS